MLAAITETLKASGQPDTAISYWASLMATLEQTGATDGKTVAGIVFLLALVFPKVPHPVLQKHFSGASKMLVAVLQQHAESGTQALMKASLNCVTHLLVAQDPAAWDASGANTLYRALLEFSTDQRAKVRREAQNGVGMLIKTIRKSRPNHPIMDSTAKFVLQGLKGQKDLARTMYATKYRHTPKHQSTNVSMLEVTDGLHTSRCSPQFGCKCNKRKCNKRPRASRTALATGLKRRTDTTVPAVSTCHLFYVYKMC